REHVGCLRVLVGHDVVRGQIVQRRLGQAARAEVGDESIDATGIVGSSEAAHGRERREGRLIAVRYAGPVEIRGQPVEPLTMATGAHVCNSEAQLYLVAVGTGRSRKQGLVGL